ncbi:MAG: alpha/beta hydrolase [Chloroflexi bacterium]|nr:alpha/beta hydrolase [Chloroflexota bacterium]MQC27980.1 alpha/beta hydrolase [Chloroflexota bacterium]
MAVDADPDYGLLDRSGISAMAFHPRPDPGPPPQGATDHMIEVEPGVAIAARFYLLGPEHPTLLYFHGNGEVVGDHDQFSHVYEESGLNLFVAEFRGYGKSGGVSSMEHLVADARPIAAYFHATLDEQGCDPRRFVMGRSMGASPALEIAARAPEGFQGAIIESGAAGVRGMLDRAGYPDNAEGWRLIATHEAKIRSIRLPTMQLHGAVDDLVPMASATELYEMLEGAAARQLAVIEGAGHNDILWRGQVRYMELVREFVAEHSPQPG